MAGTWTSERFPQFEPALRRLTEQHRELEDEPLHLAIAYLPGRKGREVDQGVFLFEVIGAVTDRFGEDEDLFEAIFDAVAGLPSGFDQTLHLILTTSAEAVAGLAKGWPRASEVVDAVRRDDFKLLYTDAIGRKVLRQIRAMACIAERSVRG